MMKWRLSAVVQALTVLACVFRPCRAADNTTISLSAPVPAPAEEESTSILRQAAGNVAGALGGPCATRPSRESPQSTRLSRGLSALCPFAALIPCVICTLLPTVTQTSILGRMLGTVLAPGGALSRHDTVLLG